MIIVKRIAIFYDFSARLPAVDAGRAASGVKDKCFGCSDSLSASELGIPRSVRLILLGSGESISLACRNIFFIIPFFYFFGTPQHFSKRKVT